MIPYNFLFQSYSSDCKKLWHHIIKKKMAAWGINRFIVSLSSVLWWRSTNADDHSGQFFRLEKNKHVFFFFRILVNEEQQQPNHIYTLFNIFSFSFQFHAFKMITVGSPREKALHNFIFFKRKKNRAKLFSCVVKLLYCHFAEFLRVLYVVYFC